MRTIRLKQLYIWMMAVVLILGTLPGTWPVRPVSAAPAGDSYTVTYNGNGAAGGNVPVDPTLYSSGDLAIVHDNSNGLKKDGYIFVGWNTKADGSGTDYLPGQTFQMGTDNVTLYAKWADPYTLWFNRQVPSTQAMNDVAFMNGMFIGVGANGLIAATIDGTVWTKQASGVTQELHDIVYGNGKSVVVGAGGTILLSTDGGDWLQRTSGTTRTLRGVAYGDGLYVAVGDYGTIVISKNGSYWTPVTSGTSSQLNAVTYADGEFIAVGSSGTILTSSDGREWTAQPTFNGFDLFGIAAGNGKVVAVGAFGTVAVSSDHKNWSEDFYVIFGDFNDVVYADSKFIAVGSSTISGGAIYASSDGGTWSSLTSETLKYRNGIAYGDGLYVSVGTSDILTSNNGENWSPYESVTFYGVNHVGSQYVALGKGVYYSGSGGIWKKLRDSSVILRDLAYGNGLYVVVGDDGTVLTSTNLTNWTERVSQTSNRLYGIVYGNGKFVAVGDGGTIIYSGDGVTWQTANSGDTLDIRDVTYGNELFVAVGHGTDGTYHGKAYWSSDGMNWSSYTTVDVSLNGIAYGDDEFYAAGVGNNPSYPLYNLFYSATGDEWTAYRSSGISGVTYHGIAYHDNTYAIAGTDGTIRVLKKGTTSWIGITTGVTTADFHSVAGGKGNFVAVGTDGAVIQTRRTIPVSNTIHFDMNGGEEKSNPEFMVLLLGDELGLLPEPPTRTGYKFVGWNTAADGTGDSADESFVVVQDMVLYAQWEELPVPPSVPSNLSSTAGVGEVDLTWDASTGADSYAVYRYQGAAAPADPSQWVLVESGLEETSYTVTGLTNETLYTFAVTATNDAGTTDYSQATTAMPGGNGSAEYPYIINSPERLDMMREDLDAYYVLTADVNLSSLGEWVPVGLAFGDSFTGHFDGNGHTISGLKVRDNPTGIGGLFGAIGSGGVIQNLVLANVDISLGASFADIGALAGKLEGSVINIRVDGGTVAGTNSLGFNNIGGLIGATSNGAVIQSSCANVQVSGLNMSYIGGLVGYMQKASVYESCSLGNVSGSKYIGGLVGVIEDSTIEDSYATGSVSGTGAIGGLVGSVSALSQSKSTLKNVYAAGEVSGTALHIGGVIGEKTAYLTVVSSYYDKDTTGQSDEEELSGTPLAHEEMGKEDSFEDWDFVTIWHLDDRDGRPTFLRDDTQAPIMSDANVSNDTPKQVSVYFPERITASSDALKRFSVSVDGTDAEISAAQLQSNGRELILTLTAPVLSGQEVTVAYEDGEPAITDKAQNRLASASIEADNEVEEDNEGPEPNIKIVSFAPQDNATGVAVNTKLTLTFNDTVEAVADKYIYLMTAGGDVAEKIRATSGYVQINGNVVMISWPANLLPLKGYYVLIDSGAFRHAADDAHGGISDPTVWNFMTEADPASEWVSAGIGFTEGDASDPVLKAGADGTLYVLFRDEEHDGKATVMKLGKYESQWSLVGSAGFSQGAANDPYLLVDGDTLYAAYGVFDDDNNAYVHVMQYELDGAGDWTLAGAPIAVGVYDPVYLLPQYSYPYLIMHNGALHVAYRDGTVFGGLTVKKLNTSGNWETLGNDFFSAGDIESPSLAVLDGTLYVGFSDESMGATVMKFNEGANDWELVGSRGFTSGNVFEPSIVTDGNHLYVVYENTAYMAAAMMFDSETGEWVALGSVPSFSAGQAYRIDATAENGEVYAAYMDQGQGNRLTVMKYAGSEWVEVGDAGFTPDAATNPSIIVLEGVPYVIYQDSSSDGKLSAMKYGVFDEPTPENSTISPTSATFDKYGKSESYEDVTTTMTLKGNTLVSISNGAKTLVKGTDYTVSGATVTIKKEYLEKQEVGSTKLTFTFSAGNPQTLTITVIDTTPIDSDVPVLQAAEPGNGQVTLRWSPMIGASEYKVFTSLTSGTYEAEPETVARSVYSYTVTGLTNGTTYYFVVKAVKEGADTEPSNEKSAIPFTVPAAPTDVIAVAGNKQATVTFKAPSDNGGREITGYEVTVWPGGQVVTSTTNTIVITGLTNGVSYTFTVVAINEAGRSDPSVPSNTVVPSAPSSGGNDSPSQPDPAETGPDNRATVLINGKEERAGTVTTTTRNNQTVTIVTVDADKLSAKLAEEGQHVVVTIPIPAGSDVSVGELNGQMITNMEEYQATLQIKTDRGTYTIPASQINISTISKQVGADVELQDIKVEVEIGTPIEEAAELGTFTLVVPPVEFTIRATYGDMTIEVTKFDSYVERTIAIPSDVDPDKITTAVVVDPDGTVRHVPTKIIVADGQYYAVIRSLTNSTYAVVWNPVEFSDVALHWAKDTVNNMGSRMIVQGAGDGNFNPDRDITRAEFAAIIVRALGLKLEHGPSAFTDVSDTDWYNRAIRTAHAYGLLSGYADGTFRPNEKITREQAMVIIARAMAITGLASEMPVRSADATLGAFTDAAQASAWAANSIAEAVQAGIVTGRTGHTLAPQDTITRAEAAAMIERLLKKSDLI